MKTIELEKTGIRLIGFYYFFTTLGHTSTALQLYWYEDKGTIAVFSEQVEYNFWASIISSGVLALVSVLIALFAMLRPEKIQAFFRKGKDEECADSEVDLPNDYTVLYRLLSLGVGLLYLQKSIDDTVQILMVSNISFAGFYGSQAAGHFIVLCVSAFIFWRPDILPPRSNLRR
tara:strand:+ start:1490 stop:2011 length:522 start_codon:yes stop_codon:yes gene_type:complete